MKIYKAIADFPDEEKYSLKSQLIRSANSVIANIAESQGRYYYADKMRILYIARGEAEETRSHLRVAQGRMYLKKEIFPHLDNEYNGLIIGINNYINSLYNQKATNRIS